MQFKSVQAGFVAFALVSLCFMGSGCKSGGSANNTGGALLDGRTSWGGVFNATINGVAKDGAINVQYETADAGEFELDDTNGPLGGSKNMTYTISGNTATVTSVECAGDTLQIQHNTDNGQVSFSGTVCGTNISGGTGQMSSN